MNEVLHALGGQIRKFRKSRGVTQKMLAADLDVLPTSVSGWELGEYAPSADIMIRLCDYFDITLDELFGREKNKPAADSDELAAVDEEIFRSLPEAKREETLRLFRHLAEQVVKDELDRRLQ